MNPRKTFLRNPRIINNCILHHTLNITELKELISVQCLHNKTLDDDLKYLEEFYQDAVSWDRKLSSLNHFLSIIIEQFEKRGIDCSSILNYMYSLENYCHFEIQEGSIRFIDSLFETECNSSLTLEEELIIAQNRIEK